MNDSYDTDMAEIEMNFVRDTHKTLEEIKQSLKSIELCRNQSVFRHIERLLREATILRIDRINEEHANHRRKTPIWTKAEELEAKMKEINDYLNPSGRISGLFPKYCSDASFQCYVLISD